MVLRSILVQVCFFKTKNKDALVFSITFFDFLKKNITNKNNSVRYDPTLPSHSGAIGQSRMCRYKRPSIPQTPHTHPTYTYPPRIHTPHIRTHAPHPHPIYIYIYVDIVCPPGKSPGPQVRKSCLCRLNIWITKTKTKTFFVILQEWQGTQFTIYAMFQKTS